jgi:hypothetical protein
MSIFTNNTAVAAFLMQNFQRDLIMGVEDALQIGAQRGYDAASGMNEGHRPSVVGQMRHFHMNETFHDALTAAGINSTPIRGNGIVVGRSGVFTVSRFNISAGLWYNGRRSRTRREMSYANRAVEPLVQPELFGEVKLITEATAFFVTSFSGSFKNSFPVSIDLAVPDREMKGWLFREPLHTFLARYDEVPEQVDLAVPKLKSSIIKLNSSSGTE